jgi:23S rRNA (adenine-N6)-dimethyltransferase
VSHGDLVVDVGAGAGVLTKALVEARARVVALELDPALAADLRARFVDCGVAVTQADARDWRWPEEPFSVVANLPFAGSGSILANLLNDPTIGLRQADVIVQWELAHKHSVVWPATLRGTYWRAWFDVGIVARLSRHAFAPPPTVDAAVLRVSRRPDPLMPPAAHRSYQRVLEHGFESRSRLRRALRPWLTERHVRRIATLRGFDPNATARDLDARQWAHLFEAVRRARGE